MAGPPILEPEPALTRVSTKIIFFVFLTTFLTALVVSWISIQATQETLRAEIERSFPARLSEARVSLDLWLGDSRKQLRELVRSETDLRLTLAPILEAPRFEASLLCDRKGEILARAGLEVEWPPPTLASLLDGSQSTAVVVSATTGARIPALVERLGDQLVLGVLDRTSIEHRLETWNHDEDAHLTLIDASGFALHAVAGAQPTDRALAPLADLDTRTGGIHEYASTDGRAHLAAALTLPETSWSLLMRAPFNELFAPLQSAVTRIFAFDLCIIVLFSLTAYRVTGAIMHPIDALSEAARRITLGQVDHEIPDPRSNDEIGLLTRSFNDMLRRLRSHQAEIQSANEQLREQNEELQTANEVLSQLSITDGLTKLHNHRYFQDLLTREIKRSDRTGQPLSMLLVDLDDFKKLNDRHGHAAGDEVLVRVAAIMRETIRDTDLVARYGGEEFVVLSMGTDLEGAVAQAEKLRLTIEQTPLIVDESMRPVSFSASIGVAQYQGNRKEFFVAADRALYRAKADGKNCVVAADEASSTPASGSA